MTDLVQRLRFMAEHLHDDGLLDYCEVAARGADRIQALEEQLEFCTSEQRKWIDREAELEAALREIAGDGNELDPSVK